MADDLDAAVGVLQQVLADSAEITLQIGAQSGAVGSKEQILRHVDDEVITIVGDGDIGVGDGCIQIGRLLVKRGADGTTCGGTDDAACDGTGQFLIALGGTDDGTGNPADDGAIAGAGVGISGIVCRGDTGSQGQCGNGGQKNGGVRNHWCCLPSVRRSPGQRPWPEAGGIPDSG